MPAGLQILVPGQFHLVETLGTVGVEMDLAQRGAHARVEAAGGDVDVLVFNFQLDAAPAPGAGFDAMKECLADAPSSIFRADANVPQAREVFAPFAVVQAIDVKRDDRAANSLFLPECAQKIQFESSHDLRVQRSGPSGLS